MESLIILTLLRMPIFHFFHNQSDLLHRVQLNPKPLLKTKDL